MKHRIIIFVMATACLVQAFDWSGYKLTEEKLPPVTIVNGNFEKGGEGWKLNDEHKVVRGEGINLSSGLVIERTDPNQYALCGQHVKGCVPGQAYNISVRVRCENVQGGKKGATIGIEHSDKDGKFISLSGTYLTGLYGTKDWTELTIRNHVIPKNAANSMIILFLGEKSTGKAAYDEINIWATTPSWSIYYPQTTQGYLPAGIPLEARITASDGSIPAANLKAAVSFQGGNDVVSAIVKGRAVFPQAASWKGKERSASAFLTSRRRPSSPNRQPTCASARRCRPSASTSAEGHWSTARGSCPSASSATSATAEPSTSSMTRASTPSCPATLSTWGWKTSTATRGILPPWTTARKRT